VIDHPPSRALAGGLLLTAALAACSPQTGSRAPGPAPACQTLRMSAPAAEASLVLIVNDTMRRDRVGIYGGPARTPAFDAFAKQNFCFDRAFTNAPWTKPAVATMLTSLYPSQHGLVTHPKVRADGIYEGHGNLTATDVLSDGYTTLAEVLRGAGFRTAAFVSNPWMAEVFGFGQGFEVYDDSFARWNAPGDLVSQKGLEWLQGLAPGERFFLYLHYIDSHRPYGPLSDADVTEHLDALANDARPQGEESRMLFGWLLSQPQQRLSAAARERLQAVGPRIAFVEMAYDRGIEAFDRALDGFLSGFSKHPAFDRTAIVITADHGEALFERGYGNHGNGLFDDEAAIPMAARLPGMPVAGQRVDCDVALIDLMPTLCTYLGVPCPTPVFGRRFIAAGQGLTGSGYIVAEGVLGKPRHRTLRGEAYKLFWEPDGSPAQGPGEYSLYDVLKDPGERDDLLAPNEIAPELGRVAGELVMRLKESVPAFERPEAKSAPVDPELERRLRSLGYLK
jgi:arylsulfatase A-like enzyme